MIVLSDVDEIVEIKLSKRKLMETIYFILIEIRKKKKRSRRKRFYETMRSAQILEMREILQMMKK